MHYKETHLTTTINTSTLLQFHSFTHSPEGCTMPVLCAVCSTNNAALKRPKTGQVICKECFYAAFEDEVHRTIVTHKLFSPGERIAIGASGGKDSTVLAHIMKTLNDTVLYLILFSIDEGITGYRDDSLETVKRNQVQYDLPLKVLSYKELYGSSSIYPLYCLVSLLVISLKIHLNTTLRLFMHMRIYLVNYYWPLLLLVSVPLLLQRL